MLCVESLIDMDTNKIMHLIYLYSIKIESFLFRPKYYNNFVKDDPTVYLQLLTLPDRLDWYHKYLLKRKRKRKKSFFN